MEADDVLTRYPEGIGRSDTPYPLGATVRLTTGETAVVCMVNGRYPLRPTVKVCGRSTAHESGASHIDLSLTLLLPILETVAPSIVKGAVLPDPPARQVAYFSVSLGAASMVGFFNIETTALGLLPVLRHIGRTRSQWTTEMLRPLFQELDRMVEMIRGLTRDVGDLSKSEEAQEEFQSQWKEPDARSGGMISSFQFVPCKPDQVVSSVPSLRGWRTLRQNCPGSVPSSRDALEALIKGVQVEERQTHAAVAAIERLLREMDKADEEFLKDVQERVPAITDRLAKLARARQAGLRDRLSRRVDLRSAFRLTRYLVAPQRPMPRPWPGFSKG